MDAIIEMILFLELSDEATLNEDAGVAAMEQLASTLQSLTFPEKEQFLHYVRNRAKQATSNNERQVLENVASNLGLV